MKLIHLLPLGMLTAAFALRYVLARRAGFPNPLESANTSLADCYRVPRRAEEAGDAAPASKDADPA